MIKAFVTAASLHDTQGLFGILDKWKNPNKKMKVIWVDAGYEGDNGRAYAAKYGIDLQVMKRIDKGFKVLPKRWVVERTLAWLGKYRRLSKDYEYHTSESIIYASMCRTMLKRLAGL